MYYSKTLTPAGFLRREKRYSVLCRLLSGEEVWAHCANPGRLLSCLTEPETPVWLLQYDPDAKKERKTAWSLEQSEPIPGVRVGVMPIRGNTLFEEALSMGFFPEFSGYPDLKREVPYGDASRVDFVLSGPRGQIYVEVKSVTYRNGDAALFPDAVSQRASRHARELSLVRGEGVRSAMVFVVMRPDCRYVSAASEIDPSYASIFDSVCREGVETYAFSVKADQSGLFPSLSLPVFPRENPACFERSQ